MTTDTLFLASRNREARTALLRASSSSVLVAGDRVFRTGEAADAVYLLASGQVNLEQAAPGTPRTLLDLVGPGEAFGLEALDGGDRRSATATATRQSALRRILVDDLVELLVAHPSLGAHLAHHLALGIQRSQRRRLDLAVLDLTGQTAATLLDLAQRFGRPVDDGILLDVDLDQRDLGRLAGASREQTNKVLHSFQRRGLVRLAPRTFVLLRPGALQARIR